MRLTSFFRCTLIAHVTVSLMFSNAESAEAEQISQDEFFALVDERSEQFEALDGSTLLEIWMNASQRAMLETPDSLNEAIVYFSDNMAVVVAADRVVRQRDEEGVQGFATANGIIQITPCLNPQARQQLRSACADGIPRLEFAARFESDVVAMRALGFAYSEGIGVAQSDLVASDWFLQAAERYLDLNDRTQALVTVERSLDLFPQNRRAIELRNGLFE